MNVRPAIDLTEMLWSNISVDVGTHKISIVKGLVTYVLNQLIWTKKYFG